MIRKPFRFFRFVLAFLSLTAGGLTESALACNTPPPTSNPPPVTVRRKSRTKVKIRIKNYTTFGVAAGQRCACGLKRAALGPTISASTIVSVDSARIVLAGTNTPVPGFSFTPNSVTTDSLNALDPGGNYQGFFTTIDTNVSGGTPTDILIDATVLTAATVAEIIGELTGFATGAANPDGTLDTSDPAHFAFTTPGPFSKVAKAYGPNRIDNTITIWTADLTNGPLSQRSAPFPAPGTPSSLVFVPNPDEASSFDWVVRTNLANNTTSPSKVDRDTGDLAVIGNFPSGGVGPVDQVSLTFGDLVYLYIAHDFSSNISIHRVDTMTGVPTPIGSVPTGPAPQQLGKVNLGSQPFVLSANCGPNCNGPGSVSVFRGNATTGLLTEVSGSPFMTGGIGTVWLTVDPSNHWLATANLGSNDISMLAINPDGTLALTGPPTPTGGTSPSSAVFDPSGGWVVVTHFNTPIGKVFAFDSTMGTLAPSGEFPTGSGTFSTRFTPDGNFFYNSNAFSANVSGRFFDFATGNTVPIDGQPFPAGSGITDVLIVNLDPTPP